MKRPVTVFALALALALLVLGPALAAERGATSARAAVLAAVNRFVDGFNKGDMASLSASCAEEASIIDEFPPHEWHGPGACAQWSRDYDADAKKNAITDGFVTLGNASHVDIAGDRAYVVGPANYAFKRNGKPEKEVGSVFTLALRKGEAGWRITGWAWAKH